MKLFGKIPMPAEVFPLVAAVTGVVTMAVVVSSRTVMYHNDVVIDKNKPFQYQYTETPRLIDKIVSKKEEQ